ncbi:MAG: hypothetical protein AAGF71_13015 [Pseudomonadota bacterium]
MGTATPPPSGAFADSIWARLIALTVGVLLAASLWLNWGDEVMLALTQGEIEALPTGAPVDVKPENPELAACLERRVGDVEQMKADGVIGDAQYTAFKQRAQDMCKAQNPG